MCYIVNHIEQMITGNYTVFSTIVTCLLVKALAPLDWAILHLCHLASDRVKIYTSFHDAAAPWSGHWDFAPLLVKMLQNPPARKRHFLALLVIEGTMWWKQVIFFMSSIASMSLENWPSNKRDIGLRLSNLGPLKPGPQMLTALICHWQNTLCMAQYFISCSILPRLVEG